MQSTLDFMRHSDPICSRKGPANPLVSELLPILRDELITHLLQSELFRRSVENICLPSVTRKIVDAKIQIGEQIKDCVEQVEAKIKDLVRSQQDSRDTMEQPSAFKECPSVDKLHPTRQLDCAADLSLGEVTLPPRMIEAFRSSTHIVKPSATAAQKRPSCATTGIVGRVSTFNTKKIDICQKSQDKTVKHVSRIQPSTTLSQALTEKTPAKGKFVPLKKPAKKAQEKKDDSNLIFDRRHYTLEDKELKQEPDYTQFDNSVLKINQAEDEVEKNAKNFQKSLRAMQKMFNSPSKQNLKGTSTSSNPSVPRISSSSKPGDHRPLGSITSRSMVNAIPVSFLGIEQAANLYGSSSGRGDLCKDDYSPRGLDIA